MIKYFKLDENLPNRFIEIVNYDKNLIFKLNCKDHIGHRILTDGYYEGLEIRMFKKLAKSNDVFLDVGANTGAWTLVAANTLSKGQVWAIEPSKWADVLEYNTFSNPQLKNISLNKLAFGRSTMKGRLEQTRQGSNYGQCKVIPGESGGFEDVDIVRLDDWMEMNSVQKLDWIKMDVEGMEWDCLQGGQQTLVHHKPKLIIEFNPVTLNDFGRTTGELLALLRQLGYIHFYSLIKKAKLVEWEYKRIADLDQTSNLIASFEQLNIA